MKRYIIAFMVLVMIAGAVFTMAARPKGPDEVIEALHDGIQDAQQQGKYRCCIEPACTMCYLGKWEFEKGTCYCDDMIAAGEYDRVCPECKKGTDVQACSGSEKGI